MDREQSVQFMHNLLRAMLSKKASDLFITAGFPPAFKVDGKMTPVSNQTLTPSHTADLARAMMNDKQAAEFEETKECNFAVAPAGIGRFRVNAFVQMARVGMVMRTITTTIPEVRRPASFERVLQLRDVEGRFSGDGDTIDARWESSQDEGRTWELDFTLTHRRKR